MSKLILKERIKVLSSRIIKDGEIVSECFSLYREFGNRFSKETMTKFKPYFRYEKMNPRLKVIPLTEDVKSHIDELLAE